MKTVEELIELYKKMKGQRSNFESYWQTLHDYFYVESADVNSSHAPGSELSFAYLWDSTTLECADVLAAGFMNYLTPPGTRWFRLRARDNALSQNKAVTEYLEEVAEEVNLALNRSNFYNQIFPTYKASGVYGTSLLLEEEDVETDIRFTDLPIKQCVIVEDAQGRVNEYFIEFEYTAKQAAMRWGEQNLTREMREEAAKREPDKKHTFLLYIAKRERRRIDSQKKENMAVGAIWIDMKGKHVVAEGGYNEFPAMAHRFDKRAFIPWGFSPAMKALPFARLLNAIAKTNLRAMMKLTDPPIAAPHNAFLMPFNMNPRAVNYYKKSKMDSGKDIFAFGNYGHPEVGMNAIEYYSMKVKSLMYNDVFLAFEGLDKQMNNPEVMERINEKMAMLGPSVGRFTAEVLNPIVIRTIGILWRRGRLPMPPDEVLNNPQYEIDYLGQLAQSQKRSQLNALVSALTMAGNMAQFAPEVLDKVDPDKATEEVWDVLGAPAKVLRDDQEVQAIRENRQQEAAKIQEMQVLGAGSQIAKNVADAEKSAKEATQKQQTAGVK